MDADRSRPPVHKQHRPVMGTMASIGVRRDAEASVAGVVTGAIDAAIDAVFEELERLEAMFSTFRADSEISQVNRGERHLLDCSAEVIDVLDACAWLTQASGGAFDISRPTPSTHSGAGGIDPAGFVKGWATERAARRLSDAGLTDWFVSVGGDLVTRGTRGPDEPWSVAIADPRTAGEVLAVFDVCDGALATSGTAERGAHLWDGRDGTPAAGWASVSVSGPSLAWADAFATVAYVMGSDGPDWVSRFDDYEAFAVGWDGTIRSTAAVTAAMTPTWRSDRAGEAVGQDPR